MLAQTLVAAVAAGGGAIVGPMLTPNARALMLGLALVAAAMSALWRPREPDRVEQWRLGVHSTAFLSTFSLALGDRTAFITFALAARTPTPALAAIGAVAGTLVLAGVAVAVGEDRWRRLPRRAISMAAGAILLLTGLAAAASGLRLI